MAITFETETCSRCNGSGEYSYCEMHGKTCFKCAGKRVTLTKRAQVAVQWLKEQNLIPASTVTVGMRIKALSMTIIVRSIELENGRLMLRGTNHALGVEPEYMVQLIRSREEQNALIIKAVEYQNTLTKTGKPRK